MADCFLVNEISVYSKDITTSCYSVSKALGLSKDDFRHPWSQTFLKNGFLKYLKIGNSGFERIVSHQVLISPQTGATLSRR